MARVADAHGAPSQTPPMHTAHGAMRPLPQGSQQSEVCVHPAWKNGMQLACSTQMPVASGLACWHTVPGPHATG